MTNRPRVESTVSNYSIVNSMYFTDDFGYNIKNYRKNESLLSHKNSLDDRFSSITQVKINNLKSSLCVLLSSFLLSLVILCGKFIGFYYQEVDMASANLIRGLVLICFSHIFFKYFDINIKDEILLNKPRNKIILMLLRCICGASGHILFFNSLKYMRISSAFTVFSLSPLIVSVFTVVLLKEKITKIENLFIS